MACFKSCALALVFVGSMVASGCGSPPLDDPSTTTARFVAIGADGTIQSSIDGARWTTKDAGVSAELFSIATGRSVFVAVGKGGTILTSPDGLFWTRRDSQTTADLSHIIFTGETFVAVGGSWRSPAGAVTVKSIDGTTWTPIQSPARYTFGAVAQVGGTLVAAGHQISDLVAPALFTSQISSGSSGVGGWNEHHGSFPDFFDSLTVGNEIMVVGSVVGKPAVSTSRDGVAWTVHELPAAATPTAIASNGSTFVVVTDGGQFYRSSNGAVWDERGKTPGGNWLADVTYGGARFVAVGGEGRIATSVDGAAWTTQVGGTTKDILGVAYGPATP